MGYADPEKRKACWQRHYQKYRQKYIEKTKKQYEELRAWLDEYKSILKCSRCDESHPATLDFHHLDPKTKDGSVSAMIKRYC